MLCRPKEEGSILPSNRTWPTGPPLPLPPTTATFSPGPNANLGHFHAVIIVVVLGLEQLRLIAAHALLTA